MKNFILTVVALKHWDYKNRLDELFETAVGKSMYITIEHDNPYQRNAVPVFCCSSQVGYVSKDDRPLALQAIRQSGRRSIYGVVTRIDRERKALYLSIETSLDINPVLDDDSSEFDGWDFNGELLPVSSEICKLRTAIEALQDAFKGNSPWNDELVQLLSFIESHYHLDVCVNTENQIHSLARLMDNCSVKHWQDASTKLFKLFGHQSNDDIIQLKLNELQQLAVSNDMNLLLNYYGDDALNLLDSIPKLFSSQFDEDPFKAIAQLSYFGLNEHQSQAIKTLLALKIRLYKSRQSNNFEELVLNYVSCLEPFWRGTPEECREFWRTIIRMDIKVRYKNKECGFFEPKNQKDLFDKVSCQKLVGIMLTEGLYSGSPCDLGERMEPLEPRNGTCARTIRNTSLQDTIFTRCSDIFAKILDKFKVMLFLKK